MAVKCRVLQGGYCEITCGYSQNHRGIDLVGKGYTLANVIAHSSGTVVDLRTSCRGFEGNGSYGNYVKIKHDDGYYTLYAHLAYNTIKVSRWQRVNKEQFLGVMGKTGYTDGGAHLHWEVRNKNDVRINPTPYLDADLPSNAIDYTGTITYQAYTNKWLEEVKKCDNTNEGYAGIYKEPITAFRCKPQYGEIIYQAKLKDGGWLEPVNSKNYNDNNANSYAGWYGKPLDCIKIKSTKGWVKYRVKTLEDGWLDWVDSRTTTGTESYAGIPNHTIIGIQMY